MLDWKKVERCDRPQEDPNMTHAVHRDKRCVWTGVVLLKDWAVVLLSGGLRHDAGQDVSEVALYLTPYLYPWISDLKLDLMADPTMKP